MMHDLHAHRATVPSPGGEGEREAERADAHMTVDNLEAGYGESEVLKGVSLPVLRRQILAIIGPSGCGKSTFLRCLNRMHELTHGAWARGRVLLDGQDVYAAGVDPVALRRRIGMVFQKPNPFPSMSIRDNVLAGLRLTGRLRKTEAEHIVESALSQAALWEDVRDRLDASAMALSGGQQQRLCIARALATSPEILLMDEPCSALDPIATARIEDLMRQLSEHLTIVIVTHNMQQAARVSDTTAFFLQGELVEYGPTRALFTTPRDSRTEDYITGRFG